MNAMLAAIGFGVIFAIAWMVIEGWVRSTARDEVRKQHED